MVKALDLRSNGHMSAWVRTPLLVVAFFSPLSTFYFLKINFTEHITAWTREPVVWLEEAQTAQRAAQLPTSPRQLTRRAGWAWHAGGGLVSGSAAPGLRCAAASVRGAEVGPELRPRPAQPAGREPRVGRTLVQWQRSYGKLPLQEKQNNLFLHPPAPAQIKYAHSSSANSSKAETVSIMVYFCSPFNTF